MNIGKSSFSLLQKIGKSLMLPVSVLPVAGILLGVGAAKFGWMPGVLSQLMETSGGAIFQTNHGGCLGRRNARNYNRGGRNFVAHGLRRLCCSGCGHFGGGRGLYIDHQSQFSGPHGCQLRADLSRFALYGCCFGGGGAHHRPSRDDLLT